MVVLATQHAELWAVARILRKMRWITRLLRGARGTSAVQRLFVHHHLGLGDSFTCNGIVRRLAREMGEGEVHLFAKECNAANVRTLYRDEPRIRIVPLPLARDKPVGEGALVSTYLRAHGVAPWEFVRIGFNRMAAIHRKFGRGISCDQAFYAQAGLPYESRFSDFYLQRDMDAEEAVYARLNPSGEPYAFVDADPARGMLIPTLETAEGADRRLRRLYNDPSVPLLQMGLLLERATELHLCESSIRCLVEAGSVFKLSTDALFLHTFRGGIWGANTRLRWTQIGKGPTGVSRPLPYQEDERQQRLVQQATEWAVRKWGRGPLRSLLGNGRAA